MFSKTWPAGVLLVLAVACSGSVTPKAEWIKRGDELVANKKYGRAAEAYRAALAADSQDGEVQFKLANTYRLAGKWATAASEAGRAADLRPTDLETQFMAAALLLGQGRFVEVTEHMSRLLQHDPNNAIAMIWWANAQAHLLNSTWALSKLGDAIRSGPGFDGARLGIRQPTAIDDDAAAEKAFRKALELEPTLLEARFALANFLWAAGRPDEGEEWLKLAADQNPGDAVANFALGSYYLSRHRDAEGERYLKQAATAGEGGRDARVVLADYYIGSQRDDDALSVLGRMADTDDASGAVSIRMATVAFRSGNRDQAIRRLDGLLARQPNNGRALLLKAQFLFATKQWDQAQQAARAAIEHDPQSSDAHATLGRIRLATGDLEGAFSEFTEALRLHPDADDLSLPLATLSLDLGRDKEALEFARDAARRHPDDPQASLALVKALVRTRDYSGAALKLKPLVAQASPSSDLLVQLGAVQAAQGNTQAARATFDKALTANRDSLEALSGLISLDLKAGTLATARPRVDQALATHPNDAGYLMLAARVYAAQNDMERAERTLRQVLTIDPANESAAVSLAAGLSRKGQAGSAREALERLLEHRPQSLEAQTELASILSKMGDTAGAQARYEKIMAQNPHDAVAASRLAILYADRGDRLDAAFDLAVTAVQQMPDNAEALDALGWVYTVKNMAPLALSYLQQAVRAVPDNAVYRSHLASAYLRKGERGKAREEFARALQIDRNFRYAEEMLAALTSGAK